MLEMSNPNNPFAVNILKMGLQLAKYLKDHPEYYSYA